MTENVPANSTFSVLPLRNLWEPSPKHLNLAYFVEFSYFLVIQTTDTYVLIIYALYAAMLWAI